MKKFLPFASSYLLLFSFLLMHNSSLGQSPRARANALNKLTQARTNAEQDIQAAAAVWQAVLFDITAGAGVSPQTP